MLKFGWKGQTPEQLARKFRTRARRFRQLQSDVVKEIGRELDREVNDRTFISSKLNAQDAPGGTARGLPRNRAATVRTEATDASASAKVTIKSFWSKARLGGQLLRLVLAALASVGKRDSIFRKGLWVKAKDGTRRFVDFARHGGLQRWAFRSDKGQQYIRHTVRIGDASLLARLIFRPTLAATRAKLLGIWRKALHEGFKK